MIVSQTKTERWWKLTHFRFYFITPKPWGFMIQFDLRIFLVKNHQLVSEIPKTKGMIRVMHPAMEQQWSMDGQSVRCQELPNMVRMWDHHVACRRIFLTRVALVYDPRHLRPCARAFLSPLLRKKEPAMGMWKDALISYAAYSSNLEKHPRALGHVVSLRRVPSRRM